MNSITRSCQQMSSHLQETKYRRHKASSACLGQKSIRAASACLKAKHYHHHQHHAIRIRIRTHPWNIEKVCSRTWQNLGRWVACHRGRPAGADCPQRYGGKRILPTALQRALSPRCTHRRRGTPFNAGLLMDGATSNFVGVQNSFETAEAGGTGVWGHPGSLAAWVKGRPHCSRVIASTLVSRCVGHQSEKAWGAPRDLRVNLLSRYCLDRASRSSMAMGSLGFFIDIAMRRSAAGALT